MLDPGSFPFPLNYTIVLFTAFTGLFIASFAFLTLREPPSEVAGANQPFWHFLRSIPGILRKDNKFLRFIIVQNTTSISLMVLPFYLVFAKEVMKIDNSFIGNYLIFQVTGTILSNFFWGRVGTVWSSKAVVKSCILLGSLVPLVALATATLGAGPYSVVFFLIGFLISGRRIGFDPYLLSLAPAGERTVYLGISGTLSILVAISPVVGGVVIELLGYNFVFLAVTLVMLTSFFIIKE
ncbi:hypothetical protein SY88_10315 [Clostridiales bacterium PH28_bin88]|nr:hypothetical protein SY88_10315 [Clostridiales bacterium PH28_bin88]